MAKNDLAIRFTDEKYLNKRGVQRALGVSLIDGLWRQILDYRHQAMKRLNLKTIPQVPFSVTATPVLSARYSAFESKLSQFAAEWKVISSTPEWKGKAEKAARLLGMALACEAEGRKIPELTLKAMLSGLYREDNPEHKPILGYRDLLASLEKNPYEPLDDNLLAKNYGVLLGSEELTQFYRVDARGSVYSTAQVSRTYDQAPSNDIDALMEGLFGFYQSDTSRGYLKAIATLYYFDYVKPFDKYNRLMGALLAKSVLAHAGLGDASALLPLEAFYQAGPDYEELSLETQREADLTYLLLRGIEKIGAKIDGLLNEFTLIKKDTFKNEFSNHAQPSEPVEIKVEPKAEPPVAVEVPRPEERRPAPVSEPKPAPRPRTEAIEESAIGDRSFVAPRQQMSEKEIREAARYIRETNPNIRPAQAKFYASHCTVGRYYTIADFKKATHCAYETARTSMDNLASEGFYRKLQIKNKYVYTPIKQSEKEN